MLTITDLFCGAGGSSTGAIQVPGVTVRAAANHWQLAVDTHNQNHGDHAVKADISRMDPGYFPTSDILWASPECTNHSIAKGKKRQARAAEADLFTDAWGENLPAEADERSRATMWDVPRFTEYHGYKAIIVENVVDAANWVPFNSWLMAMDALGYYHQVVYLNSMHAWHLGMAAPQSRDRMYVVFWRKGNRKPDLEHMQRPPAWCPEHGQVNAMQAFKNPEKKWGRYRAQYLYRCPQVSCRNQVVEPAWLPAASIIDWSDVGQRIGDRAKPLAAKTMKRIQAGIDRYWTGDGAGPLLVNNVSGSDSTRSQPITDPTPTMVAGGLHASLLVPVEGREGKEAFPVGHPYRTQTTRAETAVLMPMHLEAAGNTYDAADPNHQAYGRDGGYYRVWPGEDPLKTMHTTASKGFVFPPMLTPAGGTWNDTAYPSTDPMRTRTTRETDGVTFAPFIAELRGGSSDARSVKDALCTVTASGNHHALIMRNNQGGPEMSTPVHEPVRTLTTAGHQSLITEGQSIDPDDCHFRMLNPQEIKEAMNFPAEYQLLGNKREKVRMAGNAVTPCAARDLIGAVADTLA